MFADISHAKATGPRLLLARTTGIQRSIPCRIIQPQHLLLHLIHSTLYRPELRGFLLRPGNGREDKVHGSTATGRGRGEREETKWFPFRTYGICQKG